MLVLLSLIASVAMPVAPWVPALTALFHQPACGNCGHWEVLLLCCCPSCKVGNGIWGGGREAKEDIRGMETVLREMAQLSKCSLHKHKNPSSDLMCPCEKLGEVVSGSNPSSGGTEVGGFLRFACQLGAQSMNSRFRERPVSKKKLRAEQLLQSIVSALEYS